MDIATLVGLLGAFGLIFMAIDDMAAFIDTPSLLIVVGGSIMVVMFRSSLGEFLGAVSVMGKTFKNKLDEPAKLIEQIVELATIARKDGMIALEGQEIDNPFLSKAVSMLVDGTDQQSLKVHWTESWPVLRCAMPWAPKYSLPGARLPLRWV